MSVWMPILALLICFGLGVFAGYRYAVASRELDALMARTLAQLDLTPEDEAPCLRPDPHPVCACQGKSHPKDDWSVESWWLR